VSGAFMLVRRPALDEVGRFDEGYWLYMEDLDLCYRFAKAGWVTWYEPSAVVTHVFERSEPNASCERRLPLWDVPLPPALRRFASETLQPRRLRGDWREIRSLSCPKCVQPPRAARSLLNLHIGWAGQISNLRPWD
jgi:Glycosyltransferase like family 2